MQRKVIDSGFQSFPLTDIEAKACWRYVDYHLSTLSCKPDRIIDDPFHYLKALMINNQLNISQLASCIGITKDRLERIFLNKSSTLNVERLTSFTDCELAAFKNFILERLYFSLDLPCENVLGLDPDDKIKTIILNKKINSEECSKLLNIDNDVLEYFFKFSYGKSLTEIIETNAKIEKAKSTIYVMQVLDDNNECDIEENPPTLSLHNNDSTVPLTSYATFLREKFQLQVLNSIICNFYKRNNIECNVSHFIGQEIYEVIRIIAHCKIRITNFFKFLDLNPHVMISPLNTALASVGYTYLDAQVKNLTDKEIHLLFTHILGYDYIREKFGHIPKFSNYLKERFGITLKEFLILSKNKKTLPSSIIPITPIAPPSLLPRYEPVSIASENENPASGDEEELQSLASFLNADIDTLLGEIQTTEAEDSPSRRRNLF